MTTALAGDLTTTVAEPDSTQLHILAAIGAVDHRSPPAVCSP